MALPAAKVLGTYELLEGVLIHFPGRELFVLQSLNTSWRDLIQRSEKLQKKMFLRPIGDAISPRDFKCRIPVYRCLFHLNPACEIFRDDSGPVRCAVWDTANENKEALPARFGFSTSIKFLIKDIDECFSIHVKRSAWPQTWRKVLLTQPPITTALLMHNSNPYKDVCTVYHPQGITLGDIHEAQENATGAEMEYLPAHEISDHNGWHTEAALSVDDAACGFESLTELGPDQGKP